MKIAVSSAKPDLKAQIDDSFCRCACFIIFNTDTLEYEVLPNQMRIQNEAVCKALAQLLKRFQVETIITGSCEAQIIEIFKSEGVRVIHGVRGSILQVVEHFIEGSLKPVMGPAVESHFGLNHLMDPWSLFEDDEDTRKLVY